MLGSAWIDHWEVPNDNTEECLKRTLESIDSASSQESMAS